MEMRSLRRTCGRFTDEEFQNELRQYKRNEQDKNVSFWDFHLYREDDRSAGEYMHRRRSRGCTRHDGSVSSLHNYLIKGKNVCSISISN